MEIRVSGLCRRVPPTPGPPWPLTPFPCVPQGKVPASNILASAPSDKNLDAWQVSGVMGVEMLGCPSLWGQSTLSPHTGVWLILPRSG